MGVRVRRRTAAAGIVTVVVGSAGVAVALVAGGPAQRVPAADAAGPIDGRVHTIALRADGRRATASAQRTERFSLLGVAWDKAAAHLRGTVRVRTRSAATGTWSA